MRRKLAGAPSSSSLTMNPLEPDGVQATADDLRKALFGSSPSVFAHVVEKDGQIVASAVWFLSYSTWTGSSGIYLDDLFVRESERRRGCGRALHPALVPDR